MSYNFKILSIIFLCLTILSCKESEIKPLTEHYQKEGVEFNYNSDWVLEESGSNNISFLLFKKVNDDDFRANINLLVVQKEPSIDFEKHISSNKNYLLLEKTKILEEKIVSINGNKAYRIVHEKNFEGNNYTILQYLLLIRNKAYTITFTCKRKYYKKNISEVDEIIKTFKFES